MKKTDPIIIVRQRFQIQKNKLWEILTNIKHMQIWFFPQIAEFEAITGFKTNFLVETEERKFTHCWEILEVEEEKKIVYDWSYEEYHGKGFVIFELEEKFGQVDLTLTNQIVEDFPATIPEFSWQSCFAGWEYFIKQSLAQYISLLSKT